MDASPPSAPPSAATASPSAGLSTVEAARALGISPRAVRERIQAGKLHAELRTIAGKPAYRIFLNGEATSAPTASPSAPPFPPSAAPVDLEPLLAMLREKDQTIMELSGRVGYLMGQVEELRGQLLLTAGPAEASPTPPETATTPLRRPWWRFWD